MPNSLPGRFSVITEEYRQRSSEFCAFARICRCCLFASSSRHSPPSFSYTRVHHTYRPRLDISPATLCHYTAPFSATLENNHHLLVYLQLFERTRVVVAWFVVSRTPIPRSPRSLRSTNPVCTQAASSPRSSSLCPRVAHAHHGIKNNLVWCLPQEHQGFAADRWPRGTCVVSLALRGRYA